MEEAVRFAHDGYVVFGRIFDPAFIDELRAEYFRQFPNIAAAPERFTVGDRRLQVPVAITGPYSSPSFYANPKLLAVAAELLGEDSLIDSLAIVSALPGAAKQHRHQDHEDLFPGQPFTRALIQPYGITIVIPLVDLTPETGTTMLFRKSHAKPRDDEQVERPYIERGCCFAMDYRLTHQGTENRSSGERPMIYLVYSRPWFTDTTNYGAVDRIRIGAADLAAVPGEYRKLFKRLSSERSVQVRSAKSEARGQ